MNPLAQELNDQINQGAPEAYEALSQFGKSIFFPKGILSQSAEAKEKAHKFNATIGIALDENGPIYLPSIQKFIPDLAPKDVYPYAPGAGKAELRQKWQDKIIKENPSIQGKKISLPVITSGITHGLSIIADMFIDEGDILYLPNHFWGNYRLIFSLRHKGKIETFTFFDDNGKFNLQEFKNGLEKLGQQHKKIMMILNFPNNPTGYTPSVEEAKGIQQAILSQAEKGTIITAITDDAYFGFFFEESCLKESIFSYLAGLHKNLITIKLDGATKEEYVWGLRVSSLTFAINNQSAADVVYTALIKKVMGTIRSQISNCPHISQTLVLKGLESPNHDLEKKERFEVLKRRANKIKEVLKDPKFESVWRVYPFNSGYFMCLELKKVNAEKLRLHLLDKYGVGLISINDKDLRIAFSSVNENDIPELFELIYQGAKELE